jgi:hypothetical protein
MMMGGPAGSGYCSGGGLVADDCELFVDSVTHLPCFFFNFDVVAVQVVSEDTCPSASSVVTVWVELESIFW